MHLALNREILPYHNLLPLPYPIPRPMIRYTTLGPGTHKRVSKPLITTTRTRTPTDRIHLNIRYARQLLLRQDVRIGQLFEVHARAVVVVVAAQDAAAAGGVGFAARSHQVQALEEASFVNLFYDQGHKGQAGAK